MAVISISSSFGAGGSVVATQVGAILGWRVVNRAIPAEVAEQLSVPIEIAQANDEQVGSALSRLLARFAISLASEAGRDLPREIFSDEHSYRVATDSIIRRLAETADVVIVGRAAAVVLHDWPQTLHVRLDGPLDSRVKQAMVALKLPEMEAKRQLQQVDAARRAYVRHFYGRDWTDPRLYHLIADSTAIPLEVCSRLVIEAARARGLTKASGARRAAESS